MPFADLLVLLLLALTAAAGLGWLRAVFHGRQLDARARGLEGKISALTDRLSALEELAAHDRLTGAWNRRRFEEAAVVEMALVHRRKSPVSLLMLDLDHFKRINDTHGHGTGDDVLKGAVQVIRNALRATDTLTRWGGEEFIVLAPATSLDGARNLAERIRVDLEAAHFPIAGAITLSAGVAEHVEGETLEAWVDRADQALYLAKTQGRNRTEVHPARDSHAAGDLSGLMEIVWDEAFECGNSLVDSQHRKLVQLANGLLAALLGGQPQAEVEPRMTDLFAHTAQHFRDEEALLQASAYPELAAHQAEHIRLLATAQGLRDDVKGDHVELGRLVSFVVGELIKGHILTTDRHYFPHLGGGPAGSPS
jgi:diguanylate cyclase (GGDEF)-like protein/hemerythrin-like metal-binding protein